LIWRTPLIVVARTAAAIYGGIVVNDYDFRKLATAPPRPKGVPPEVVWDGGMKGGSFILCDIHPREKVNHCIIYHASSGIIWSQSDFRLMPGDKAARANTMGDPPALPGRQWKFDISGGRPGRSIDETPGREPPKHTQMEFQAIAPKSPSGKWTALSRETAPSPRRVDKEKADGISSGRASGRAGILLST